MQLSTGYARCSCIHEYTVYRIAWRARTILGTFATSRLNDPYIVSSACGCAQ